ncbi:hypothetical protein BGW80DRAFT_1253942 [Lactifluus volemus]|nr:hypothetical protein BGW80DRAFT_1253942 [Lactifluus volemus]
MLGIPPVVPSTQSILNPSINVSTSVVGLSKRLTTAVFPSNGACEQVTRGNIYQQRSIDILPDDILLEVFDCYRLYAKQLGRGKPWKWQCLAHVCRRWRYILSNSPHRLGLRIIVKTRAPMKSILDSWPALPIVIRYTGSQKSKSKALNNIIVALHYPDRVCEIDLVGTSSMLGTLSRLLQKPFTTLERIRIISNDTIGSPLLLPDTFLGGYAPRLHMIQLGGISLPFSATRRLLESASDLVTLELHHIRDTGYFSPEDLITVLSTLARLRRLSLRFDPRTSRLTQGTGFPPPSTRWVTLPSLNYFEFHGASEYLEVLVSKINLPALRYFSVSFFNQLIFEIPQLCRFIGLVDTLSSPTEVIVEPSQRIISITLARREERRSFLGELCFHISCRQLDWQLSSTTQIFSQLSPFLSHVRSLAIKRYGLSQSKEGDDVNSTQWLELFQSFNGVRSLSIAEKFVPDVVQVLGMATDGVLPALTLLNLEGYHKSASVQEAAQLLLEARRRSGAR